jgi:hypothetical protein
MLLPRKLFHLTHHQTPTGGGARRMSRLRRAPVTAVGRTKGDRQPTSPELASQEHRAVVALLATVKPDDTTPASSVGY